MSLIVRFTAALWAALTNINADHRQSKLRLINNLLPFTSLQHQCCPLAQQLAAHPKPTPLYTRKRQKKKVVTLLLKKKNEGSEGSGTTAHPRLSRLPVSSSFAWAQAQQPSPLFAWYSVSPYTVVHRLRVVVSPVPAACPLRPLDTQFWLTPRNGTISPHTRAEYHHLRMPLPCPSELLPNWTVLDIRRASSMVWLN